jgi:hypothetical protein
VRSALVAKLIEDCGCEISGKERLQDAKSCPAPSPAQQVHNTEESYIDVDESIRDRIEDNSNNPRGSVRTQQLAALDSGGKRCLTNNCVSYSDSFSFSQPPMKMARVVQADLLAKDDL